MDLGGDDHNQDLAVLELVSLSGGDPVVLELAGGRCLALLGLLPDDPRAGPALDLLTHGQPPIVKAIRRHASCVDRLEPPGAAGPLVLAAERPMEHTPFASPPWLANG